jgi:transmembrane sensor
MLSFEAGRLDEAIAEANRYSTAKIRFTDPAIGGLRVTGAYRAGDTHGLARSLASSFDLQMTSDARGDIILAPAASTQEKN